ncbi:helix-turn-helix domain-containing protein [Butyrivibrio sp. XPD2006]|uniref:helix-turn-helix domain-containing protein n=1 Tax=Butyrivibrio sp. XPD2006 TaxID=1280668 RepID=UPI0003B3A2CD|nr:helix-turn-helix transcriptional regulator [Butyrivibrio sp. XPD2006]
MSIKVINQQATCANIFRIMKEKGLTPVDIQKGIGFASVQGVYKWKFIAEGKPNCKGMPSTDTLFLLADVLGVSIEDIVVRNKINV